MTMHPSDKTCHACLWKNRSGPSCGYRLSERDRNSPLPFPLRDPPHGAMPLTYAMFRFLRSSRLALDGQPPIFFRETGHRAGGAGQIIELRKLQTTPEGFV